MVQIVPRPKKADPGVYGELKKQKQFMITETASDLLDAISDQTRLTRSEIIERLIRLADVDAVKSYEPDGK